MNQQNFDLSNLRPLAWALYAVAAMLILVPFVELGGQLAWTMRPDLLNWRAGTAGLLSSLLATPTFGLFLAIITAFLFGHRWAQIGFTVLTGLATVATVGVLALFTLDALQLRPGVTAQMQQAFTASTIKASLNFAIISVTLAFISISAFRAGRWRRKSETATRPSGSMAKLPLITHPR